MEVFYRLISGNEFWQMVIAASPLAKFVLVLLLMLSIGSWVIICWKVMVFRTVEKNSDKFLSIFRNYRNLRAVKANIEGVGPSPVVNMFHVGYDELLRITKALRIDGSKEQEPESKRFKLDGAVTNILDRVLQSQSLIEQVRMEKYLSFLATTGNTAPFVGLFGTVWGIMDSFRSIGIKGSASLAVVAPGIAEALIATAAGIAVAVPAVVAFNALNNRIAQFKTQMDVFRSEFLSVVDKAILMG